MLHFLKKEKVLTVALGLALVSMLFVPPDGGYMGYIDFRVLALLFCLMLLVKGLQSVGLFDALIRALFGTVHGTRRLCVLLVMLCFFTSMLITNDVALLTFVPFAMLALDRCGKKELIIRTVVLQTVAANLGSMATPVGNPQNLYLFSAGDLEIGAFFAAVLPVAGASLVLILLACFLMLPNEPVAFAAGDHGTPASHREIALYAVLFAVNLLVVFRVLHFLPALFLTVLGVLLFGKRSLFHEVDYALLLTFVGFFVFVGNLGRVEAVSRLIERLLVGREVLVSALFSQFLSNVPAALLLSGFTGDTVGLVIGTNVGGLGTLIASMASLISYKLYSAREDAEAGRYMLVFTAVNVIGLILLLAFSLLVLRVS